MKPLSLRWKFAWWSGGLTATSIVFIAAGTLFYVQEEQMEIADAELASEAQQLANLHFHSGNLDAQTHFETESSANWLAIVVFGADGAVRLPSRRLSAESAALALGSPVFLSVTEHDRDWRIRSLPMGEETLVVGHDLDEINSVVNDLLAAFSVALPLISALAGLGAWGIAGLVVSPLRELTRTAEVIGSHDLRQRVAVSGRKDEIGRLETVFNRMLARLETAFLQSKRFAADASHELRTPLTILRGQVDQLLREENLEGRVEEGLLSLQHEISRLQRICENLLLLSRFDAGQVPLDRARVDFSSLVNAACDDARMLAASRFLRFESDLTEGIAVSGDPDYLRRVLLNLVDNAVKFCAEAGAVRIRLSRRSGRAWLAVGNSGPRVPPENRDRIFERFGSSERRNGAKGHGLGLSLSREIARAHGGELSLSSPTEDDWVEFVLALPLDERPAPPSAVPAATGARA